MDETGEVVAEDLAENLVDLGLEDLGAHRPAELALERREGALDVARSLTQRSQRRKMNDAT